MWVAREHLRVLGGLEMVEMCVGPLAAHLNAGAIGGKRSCDRIRKRGCTEISLYSSSQSLSYLSPCDSYINFRVPISPFYIYATIHLTFHHHHGYAVLDVTPSEACAHLRRVAQRARHPRSLYPDDEEKGRGTWRSPDQDIGRQSRCTSRSFLSPHCVQQCSPQEIAIRVFRTAHELAMHTVAIYSYEDRLSAHRQKVCRCYHCYDIAAQPRMYSPMRRTRSERA